MQLVFKVTVPTDQGFLGRACNALGCKQYFKVHVEDRKPVMQCPYCGTSFPEDQLFTKSQIRLLEQAARTKAEDYVQTRLKELAKRLSRRPSPGSPFSLSFTVKGPAQSPTVLGHNEREVDTQLECCSCNCRFQVYGVFGYCPRCGESNMAVYDTNWAMIGAEISNGRSSQRSLRHGYNDLVSSFEIFCRGRAKRFVETPPSFQVLFDARGFFKDRVDIDMLSTLENHELLSLRRVFQKRHVYTHAGGTIGERYIKMIPEDKGLLGQKAELSLAELKKAATAMRKAIGLLVAAMEKPG